MIVRGGTTDAATGERRGLVEQIVDRTVDLELLQVANVQVVRPVQREVQVQVRGSKFNGQKLLFGILFASTSNFEPRTF